MKKHIAVEICQALTYQSNFYELDSKYFIKHKHRFVECMLKNAIKKVSTEPTDKKIVLPLSMFTEWLSKEERTIIQKEQKQWPIRHRMHHVIPKGGLEKAQQKIRRKFPNEIMYLSWMITEGPPYGPDRIKPLYLWKRHSSHQWIDSKTGRKKNSKEQILKLESINLGDGGETWSHFSYKERKLMIGSFADDECKFYGRIPDEMVWTFGCGIEED